MPKSNVLPKGNFGLDVKIELSAKKIRLRRPPRPPKSMLEPAKARRASPSFLPEVSVGMENRESWYASTPCFWHSTLIFGGRGGGLHASRSCNLLFCVDLHLLARSSVHRIPGFYITIPISKPFQTVYVSEFRVFLNWKCIVFRKKVRSRVLAVLHSMG